MVLRCLVALSPPASIRQLKIPKMHQNHHYHIERNHQGFNNELIVPLRIPPPQSERIDRRTRLNGVRRFYERAAAWRCRSC